MMPRRTFLPAAMLGAIALASLSIHAEAPRAMPPAKTVGPLGRMTLPSAIQPIPGSDADCSDLVIDAKRVRYFWTHASEGPASDFQRDVDLADCAATATLHLPQGTRGTLHLHDATGWGVLEWKGSTRYFRCATCENILGREFFTGNPPK
ncbi:Secreted protein [Paracidovorax anthurii]|uniref:Uncharacterized protein n=3 Tax=Paracidovorax anthurii TaxID=78229 RepID=A0A328ZJH3_9BURK|nr:hypothetical protein AX018_100312 [Paracidovorax anthurii]